MNPEKLRKFFKGDCSAEEVYSILRWINTPEGKKELERFFDGYHGDYTMDSRVSEGILAKIKDRIDLDAEPEVVFEKTVDRKIFRMEKLAYLRNTVAACVVVFLVVWGVAHFYSQKGISDSRTASLQAEWIERSVPVGQKLKLRLGDGTEVILNSLSSIRFPRKFSEETREVFLEGEGFFEVTPEQNRPFIVRSDQMETKVLGTSFLVRTADDKPAMVAVLTGKVQVSLPADQQMDEEKDVVVLEPMDAVKVSSAAGSFDRVPVEYDEVFAWKDDVISFKETEFQEVVGRLEKWYGVKILLPDSWRPTAHYTGRFEKQTLEEVLLGLSFVYDFQFRIDNSTVTIYR
ncbi:FecR family protein [Algoriphagus terrigena]|uniref:FecR family protein n=1 Tax=Algoriphagus terrigena TaxID=344884 RepID=UPI000414DED0|nr:FecR domain-containing protein [Algoriphagus terrigena]